MTGISRNPVFWAQPFPRVAPRPSRRLLDTSPRKVNELFNVSLSAVRRSSCHVYTCAHKDQINFAARRKGGSSCSRARFCWVEIEIGRLVYVCLCYVYFIVLSFEAADIFRLGCVRVDSEVFYCFIWRILSVVVVCWLKWRRTIL